MTTRVFTGLKPTGQLRVGNHLGHPAVARPRGSARCRLARQRRRPARAHPRSSVPAHTELSYLLESTSTYGEMRRMMQFKAKSRGQESTRLSLLTYPALMAADILAYQTEVLPVGEDQRQHPELRRHRSENPSSRHRHRHRPNAHLRPGRQIPGVANLAVLLGALTGRPPEQALDGLHGAAALKGTVVDVLVETMAPIQERYRELLADPAEVFSLLRSGTEAVAGDAAETAASAREAMGLLSVS